MRVDDDLLALCNAAFDEAVRRAAPRVEIAHVFWCLAVAADNRRWIDATGVSRFALSVAVNRWLVRAAMMGGGGAPGTSPELKTLLARAEAIASRDGVGHASPAHFLAALLTDSADLASAAFSADLHGRVEMSSGATAGTSSLVRGQVRSQPRPEAGAYGSMTTMPAYRAPPHSDNRASERPGAPRSWDGDAREHYRPSHQLRLNLERSSALHLPRGASPRRSDDDDSDPDGYGDSESRSPQPALLDRLARQNAEIAELRGMLAKLLHRARDTDRRDADDDESDGSRAERSGSRPGRTRGFRARLRLRPGHWSRRADRALSHPADRQHHEGEALAERPHRSPQRPRDAREADDYPMRMRAARNSALREAMLSTPDNDVDSGTEGTGDRMKRFYLSPDDDIVRAPSIGPRTAARLIPAGLVLVRDLLTCDPAEVAAKVGARYMTADRIADWKAQARLVCTIPWLRGTHAQLLVGAGYDTIGKLARADASIVCAAILRFAATREGQSILRSGPPPEIDRIACWIENTALAEPQRAA